MNSSTSQNNSFFQNGLNIHLLSFSLPKKIVKEKENIRLSITTLPDEVKQHFSIKGKLMNYTNHLFSLNISNKTKNIVLVFRKKTLVAGNDIIASAVIQLDSFKEFPREQITSGTIETEIKNFNIYYPLQKQKREEKQQKVDRIILGQMKIQFSFTTPFKQFQQDKVNQSSSKNKSNNNKNNKENKPHKIKRNSKIENYNEIEDSENVCEFLL